MFYNYLVRIIIISFTFINVLEKTTGNTEIRNIYNHRIHHNNWCNKKKIKNIKKNQKLQDVEKKKKKKKNFFKI